MNNDIIIDLNSEDITNAIKKLQTLKKDLKDIPDLIARETAYNALTYLDIQYAETPYDDNIDDIHTFVERTIDGYRIGASGKDVVYAEFGSGDLGEQNPHPEKAEYSLNAYNSGETIREANEHSAKHGITSGKYWTYEKNGSIHYTQGIPAGKQVFNTRNYIIEKGLDKATKKVMGDVLSKL